MLRQPKNYLDCFPEVLGSTEADANARDDDTHPVPLARSTPPCKQGGAEGGSVVNGLIATSLLFAIVPKNFVF